MTKRYPGGYITKTAPTVSTTSAPGIWTMEQQAAYQKAGTWPFGGPFNYIEDVFSTYLYTGNGSTQTITNGIDLSGKGGLVWLKGRSLGYNNGLFDTVRGADFLLCSNNTDPSTSVSGIPANAWITGFNSNGFGLGSNGSANSNTQTYVSWTFREQPKFFDVVTYTGNYTARTIAHSLGSVPGCIIVKKTSSADDWRVYHRSLATNQYMTLETTAAVGTSATMWNNTAPTSTVFSIGAEGSVNDPGETFVAYLFAHNAGGFGNTGTDNVISCGSYTGNGSSTGPVIDLGYEPQWLMIKNASNVKDWIIFDSMRGFTVAGQNDPYLFANSSQAENPLSLVYPTATGFGLDTTSTTLNTNGDTYIYIAIRRGPMKTPTSGTSVFAMDTQGSTTPRPPSYKSNFPVDWAYTKDKGTVGDWYVGSRLTGPNALSFNSTIAESPTAAYKFDYQNGWLNSTAIDSNRQSWMFQRAPGFFDEVCYTGTGSARTVNHNLGVVPELMIVKRRDSTGFWAVYSAATGAANVLELQSSAASTSGTAWNSTSPTASVFTVGNTIATGASGGTYVAYLFASCPGVSKVGSYSGTGATQTISCGFAARFVLIKRTDSTGNWFVWDTARGMVAGTDPRLALNTTDAELNNNWVYTDASGFQIVTTDATVNASGGTYLYLAIA